MSKWQLKAFGKNVKKLRLDKDLTQEELAEKIGVSANYIGMVERAERNISLMKVFKIAKILGIKPKELFEFE